MKSEKDYSEEVLLLKKQLLEYKRENSKYKMLLEISEKEKELMSLNIKNNVIILEGIRSSKAFRVLTFLRDGVYRKVFKAKKK